MSRYVQQQIFKTTFDGDSVTVYLNPLEYGDLTKVDGLASKGKALTDSEAVRLYAELVPKYLTKIEGLVDGANNPVPAEVVGRHVYFTSLLVEIGTALLQGARPKDPSEPASVSDS